MTRKANENEVTPNGVFASKIMIKNDAGSHPLTQTLTNFRQDGENRGGRGDYA